MQNQHPMQQFHDLLNTITTRGFRRLNKRTGEYTYTIPGAMMVFDMQDGFPAITTKKLAFKSMKGELFGFFRGYDSAAQFRELGCKVWDGNANETQAWLDNPLRQKAGTDFLGRVYGKQWTDWRDWRAVPKDDHMEVIRMIGEGYEIIADDGKTMVFRKGINQLEAALSKILTDPSDRRIIVDAWRVDEFDQMALPPCHVAYQWLVDIENGELHMTMWQRSFDTFLAFNVSMGALFLEIMARLSGLRPRTFTHFISDCHVYEGHLEQVKVLLAREHHAQPRLLIDDSIKPVALNEVPGIFAKLDPEAFKLDGYVHHDPIPAKMAV